MSAKPWHKRWHGNALNGMRSLSLELRGAYQTLLDLMYDAGGPIRLEERRICGEFDCDVRVFKRVIGALIEAGKIRLWSDGETVWIVNDKVLDEVGCDGFEVETSAELSPNLRDKFAIANAQLSPKSGRKVKENNGGGDEQPQKNEAQRKRKEEYPLKSPKGDEPHLFDLDALPVVEPEDPVEVAFSEWNDLARRCGLPVAKSLDDARRRAIAKRLEDGGIPAWREALVGVERSAILRGLRAFSDGRKMRADLGFVCQAKSFPRLREGFYGTDAPPAPSGDPSASAWAGPADVREVIETTLARPEYAATYLAACKWRDVPTRALVTASKAIFDRLSECRRALSQIGVELVLEQWRAA